MDWTCPYCNHPTTLTSPNVDTKWLWIDIAKDRFADGQWKGLKYLAITCPNAKCKQLALCLQLTNADNEHQYSSTKIEADLVETWTLLPESAAKPQPAYIPKQIVNDYTEACRIASLSPKASATLSRRCLQGMIRDFWGIRVGSGKLYDEITALEELVSPSEWEAIDALRSVGNIGAHMKQDVNTIIDVGPEEASLLIQFIEGLFKDWYVIRHDREERNRKLKELAISKGEKPRESKTVKAEEVK